MNLEKSNIGPNRKFVKLKNLIEKCLKKCIEKYIESTQHAFNVKDVASSIYEELGFSFSVNFLRRFMKTNMNLTYKRVKPRPNNVDLVKLDLTRKLFAVKIVKYLSETTLIINMDQSSINRNIKFNRSWGLKGVEIELKNSIFSGSVSLWMAVLSNGSWICLQTNDSEKIINFLNYLSKWLKDHDSFNYSEIFLILDNWSIQKSLKVKQILAKLNWKVMYLPV